MANGRNKNSKGDSGRDSGGFIALPWSVIDCPAYARLSHPAKALLLEVARQFHRDDNGRMLLSRAYLATRGWKSADTITNAKRELLEGGLIFQTVLGHRPNKASWYAVTWRALDKLPGYDAGMALLFERGAYQKKMPVIRTSLRPPAGTVNAVLVPPAGTETLPTVPSAGTIRSVLGVLTVPPAGHPLEMPSIADSESAQQQATFTVICVAPAQPLCDTPNADGEIAAPEQRDQPVRVNNALTEIIVAMTEAPFIETTTRHRDCDQTPDRYDPDSGDFTPTRPLAPRRNKQACDAALMTLNDRQVRQGFSFSVRADL